MMMFRHILRTFGYDLCCTCSPVVDVMITPQCYTLHRILLKVLEKPSYGVFLFMLRENSRNLRACASMCVALMIVKQFGKRKECHGFVLGCHASSLTS